MSWIYLSPHFDDVALSCGGLLWEQVLAEASVSLWTVCAGEIPSGSLSPFAEQLHVRWETGQNAPPQRSTEDIRSCRFLGASYRHFPLPDCIYRRDPQSNEFMYASEPALNGSLQSGNALFIHSLQESLEKLLPADASLVCPLALGNHVDHQLTRQAAEGLHRSLWYYADYPYVLQCKPQLEQMEREGWEFQLCSISRDGLAAWLDSISAHASQISTFWSNDPAMRQAVADYWHYYGGIRLWRKPAP